MQKLTEVSTVIQPADISAAHRLLLCSPWSQAPPLDAKNSSQPKGFIFPGSVIAKSLLFHMPTGYSLLYTYSLANLQPTPYTPKRLIIAFKAISSLSLPHYCKPEPHQWWLNLAYNYFLSYLLSDIDHKYQSTHPKDRKGSKVGQHSTQLWFPNDSGYRIIWEL